MKIEHKLLNETLYIGLSGELDNHAADYVRRNLDTLFEASVMERIVVEMSELTFMDSTGIGVMIGRFKKMKQRNIPIFIAHPSRQADKIFSLSGLYDIMPKIV
ncbi:MAG: anti-sigma factor antagonist [Firmicutes bacterium]|nr:anti-sigma factor antagonist [Bacillota bacterium]